MKTLKAITLLILTTIFFVSCDPAKLLVIRAENKNTSSVTVYTNNKIVPFGNKDDNTKFTIQVPFNDTTSKSFNYGIGNWSNDAIKDLSTNIDSIIITNSADKLVLVNKSEIENYLKKHRSGYAGSILTIEAK